MIKLGITGGIASGKSLVTKILSTMGYPVYLTDDRAKELMITDPIIKKELIELFGTTVYLNDGSLNKKRIADAIFNDKNMANAVSSIVHPRVKTDFLLWAARCEAQGNPLVVMECAILIEANFIDAVDVSLLVYAPESIRIERAVKRDNTTRDLVEKRIRAQFSEEEKMNKVDYTILNDDKSLVLPQLMTFLDSALHITPIR